MSTESVSILSAVIGVHTTAIVVLAVLLSRLRERLAVLEQKVKDKVNGDHR